MRRYFYTLIPFNKIVLPAATLICTLCRTPGDVRRSSFKTHRHGQQDEYFNKGQYSKGQLTDKEQKTHVH